MGRFARGFVLAGLAASLAGCGVLPRNPVPPELTPVATIAGMPDVRAWAGRTSEAMERDFAQSFAQESPADFPRGADGAIRYPHLALSGGGANGAFGAGFLNGWTATGTRPVFKIVTGVSTGALMAPFAFLGPSYDGALHEFYTTTTTRDIFSARIDPGGAAERRVARGQRPARGADRPARRRAVSPRDRRRARPRPAALHRHRRSRFPAVRGLEHGPDRGERPPGVARSLPQGHARVGVDTDRLSAGVLRGRGRRPALRRDARRRRDRGDRLPARRRVQAFPHPRAGRPRPGAGGHLRDPQRAAARAAEPDAAVAARDRFAGHRSLRRGPGWSAISSASMRSRSASRRASTG